jgi:general secretion pathway protein D
MYLRPLVMSCALLAGCAQPPMITLPPKMEFGTRDGTAAAEAPPATAPQTQVEAMPAPPATAAKTTPPPPPLKAPPRTTPPAQVNFEQLPLTTVIQVVFADVLGRTVQIDPKVMERRDLVTFRTPPDASAEQIETAMQVLLRSYGIALVDVAGTVRVFPDNAQSGTLPEIRRGAALPETPSALRPVFQLVELQAVRNTEVAGWLKTLFGSRVNVSEDAGRNAVVLSGSRNDVQAALDAIRVLDQPVMSGRASLRITPVYWSAPELAQTLTQVLTAEGYSMAPPGQAAQSGGVRYPIILLPVSATNSLLVFTISDTIAQHVQQWVNKLDQPNKQAAGKNLFVYTARNTSADTLAKTLAQLVTGGGAAEPAPAAAAAAAAPGGPATRSAAASISLGGGRVVVDSNSNTLIFNTSAENYSQIIGLLNTLDRPSKAALIEVTVAEIRLGDDLALGVEWLLNESGTSGTATVAKTLGGLGLGTAGLTIARLGSAGDTRLVLNALATSNLASVLSSPRVMARNGETSKIQVGQEVPIITSQQSTPGTNLGVLQTVQYRNTGVILTVKPSIFSGDRIDLDVSQEVSAAQSTQTGVNVSPTFITRKVETKLTLQHGSTVVLGGLIANDQTDGSTGVPWLKDIPVVGYLFKSDSKKQLRTELVVLITPYIINDDADARGVTESFRQIMPMLDSQIRRSAEPAPAVPAPNGAAGAAKP